jgi:putative hydrolase of the HAD superfamily
MAGASRLWIFDLDDTLHDASAHIFPHINRSMTSYLQQHLQLSEEDADALRRHYWQRYGATMKGMMRHHGTDPAHFLHHTHQFPTLEKMVLYAPRLRHVLRALPGKKALFSNAPQVYAHAVLKLLRVADLFADVVAMEQTGYRPKPDAYGFRRLMRKHRVRAAQCVMVEDSLANLQVAKRLGMRTVWISAGSRMPPCVDFKVSDVLQLSHREGL